MAYDHFREVKLMKLIQDATNRPNLASVAQWLRALVLEMFILPACACLNFCLRIERKFNNKKWQSNEAK
ncbi:hypothetical protein QQP08_012586 [Theobroma cacao]|nr:hypothetical protein QQP08_012586 [Theobroma cacao]